MNLKKIENPFGGMTYYKETTTSTMAEAANLLSEKDIHGSIVLADFQTNGIGRVPGRKWLSSEKENLTFTLIIKKDFIGHGFGTTPLKAGLALSKAVKNICAVDSKVKWPNDVVVNNKKISGILCQSQKGYILVGIGINVNQLNFDESIKDKATSLSLVSEKGFNLEMVLSKFLSEFFAVLKSETWLDELNNCLYKQNDEVSFSIGNPENKNIVTGLLVGLDKIGKVIIKDANGKENSYLSGEFI
ncbi:MAG: biotin--[acetyl-CoA-carboxylase] ligase [Spirochaetaceae bacterium]